MNHTVSVHAEAEVNAMVYPLSQQLVLMCKCKTVTLQTIVNIETQEYFTMTLTAVTLFVPAVIALFSGHLSS